MCYKETQRFWIELLTKVFDVDGSTAIAFEAPVKLDHTSFIDGHIEFTSVLIKQKGRDIDLSRGYKQSDSAIGVNAHSGLVHTMTATATNAHDITQAANLIREDDEVVYGDSAYFGIQKRSEVAGDAHLSSIDFHINRRPGSLAHVSDKAIDRERHIEFLKSSARCKVEHVFRTIKCLFGYRKTVYRGFRKNENHLYAMFACANLYVLARAGRNLSPAW